MVPDLSAEEHQGMSGSRCDEQLRLALTRLSVEHERPDEGERECEQSVVQVLESGAEGEPQPDQEADSGHNREESSHGAKVTQDRRACISGGTDDVEASAPMPSRFGGCIVRT